MRLVLIIGLTFLFFSCQRAVDSDKAKVVITLPDLNNGSDGLQVSSSNKIEAFTDTADSAESADLYVDADSFNSNLIPTNFSGTTPLNCFLIAVSGPEEIFKRNYCEQKTTVAGTVAATSAKVYFGPFMGLRQASQEFNFELDPGKDRKIYIFGFRTEDLTKCTDLALQDSKKKSDFSKPYLIGSSELINFESGKEINVKVNLEHPTETKKYDNCEIQTGQGPQNNDLPLAEKIFIEQRNFPYNNLVANSSGDVSSAASACQPLDIVLRTNDFRLARLSSDQTLSLNATLSISGATVPNIYFSIFDNYNDCKIFPYGSSKTQFTIPKDQFQVRKWVKFYANFGINVGTANLSIQSNLGLQSNTVNFNISQSTNTSWYIGDGFIPRMMIKDQCYPVEGMKRIVADGSSITPTSLTLTSTNSSNFEYYTDASCSTAASGNSFSGNGIGYIKPINNGFTNLTLMASGYVSQPRYINVINTPSSSYPVNNISFQGSSLIKNGQCTPLILEFLNFSGINTATTATSTLAIDTLQSSMGNVSLHSNSSCTTGSALTAAALTTNILTAGESVFYKKVFLKYTKQDGASPSEKSIQFKYNGNIIRKFSFIAE